ncbi:MAG: hypothetical protein QOD09_3460 [Bradyrhizobium sp.]|jgi:hypothetical protein|nr:hypothetical protein [Bradyrhizobium sp.]
MAGLASGLLRTGLALKANQIKRATTSYAHDRVAQGQGIVVSYAVAAGLYAAAGIFLIAAALVGVTALFRWIEINYGLFWAFGAVGGLLLLIAMVCAGFAASKLKRPAKQFPSLSSRLRVAVKANPITASPVKSDRVEEARDTAAAILSTPAEPLAANSYNPHYTRRTSWASPNGRAALIVVATLMGWAMARRHHNARKAKI